MALGALGVLVAALVSLARPAAAAAAAAAEAAAAAAKAVEAFLLLVLHVVALLETPQLQEHCHWHPVRRRMRTLSKLTLALRPPVLLEEAHRQGLRLCCCPCLQTGNVAGSHLRSVFVAVPLKLVWRMLLHLLP